VRKETYQIGRDPSSIAIGVVLPVLLILLFGYGLSLDVRHVPVAVVLEDASPEARALAAGFQLSPYFDVQLLTSMPRAQELMLARQVDGIVRIRPDFARRLASGTPRYRFWSTGPTPTAPASSRAMRRGRSTSGRRARAPKAARSRPGR
jgi:ABC-2 type transport system permease protein